MDYQWKEYESAGFGITAQYCQMYLDMVLILKKYIHAERLHFVVVGYFLTERSCNWEEHLNQVNNMLPFTVSSNHHRYSICLPVYLNDMIALSEKSPAVYQQFLQGNFAVHHVGGSFNGVSSDMALEQSYNQEGKTTLLKGISQNPSARN